MGNNKGQSVFLTVVGVATLLVAIVGATFAYFSITVAGNNTASSIQVTTANLGTSVTFTDGTNINVTNIYPGWYRTKTFTVAKSGTETLSYIVTLNVITNTLSAAAPTAFVYSLFGSSTNSGTLVSATNVAVPGVGVNTIGTTGSLNGTDTHTYTFTIRFNEMSIEQNAAQNKAFAGVLQVNISGGAGMRTWNNTTSTWTSYQ